MVVEKSRRLVGELKFRLVIEKVEGFELEERSGRDRSVELEEVREDDRLLSSRTVATRE